MYQEADLDRPRKEQTQQRAFHDGAALKINNEKSTNWGDYYQNRITFRDSRTATEPQEKNVRPGDYVQIRSRPTDKAAEAREDYYQNRPTLGDGHWRRTLEQAPQQAPPQV